MIKVGLITVSDKGSRGEREDISGQTIKQILPRIAGEVCYYRIVPDEFQQIKNEIIKAVEELKVDLLLTTGGTGMSRRDVTPEATLAVIEKPVPGITEIIRLKSFEKTPRAILSRAVAGIKGKTLIVNLPGSPKGVRESLEIILEALPHGIDILRGDASECGQD